MVHGKCLAELNTLFLKNLFKLCSDVPFLCLEAVGKAFADICPFVGEICDLTPPSHPYAILFDIKACSRQNWAIHSVYLAAPDFQDCMNISVGAMLPT